MSITFHWVGASDEELDRVAETRMRCYAHSSRDIGTYRDAVHADPRAVPGDFLIGEQDRIPVGTLTALRLKMWLRGAAIPCLGITQVGTIKTHRRRSCHAAGPGIATQLMNEAIRTGRERGDAIAALTPFRGSFYERSGFGVVERRCKWTVPLPVLPTGAFEGVRFYGPSDLSELRRCRQRTVEHGQCDIERPDRAWDRVLIQAQDGFVVVDRPDGGAVRGWAWFRHAHVSGKDLLRVAELGYEDVPALLRLLHFFASLRDQYASALLTLPADLPLNRLLREGQVPHRPVNHATAECRPFTRMQVRVLDSKRLIEPMHLPVEFRGSACVAVHKTGGEDDSDKNVKRFRIQLEGGRAEVTTEAADGGFDACDEGFECRDSTWSSIVCGDLPATAAVTLGLARDGGEAAGLLDAFSRGPVPFAIEDF